jgi:O-antigen/teichoic acid export membrane protein
VLLIAVLKFCSALSAEELFLGTGLVVFALLCVAIWRLPRQNVKRIQVHFSWNALKPQSEMWHLMAGALCYPLVLSILLAMLAQWVQLSEAGVFAVVCSLALITLVPLNMINQASIQTFSRLKGDPAGLKRAFTAYRHRALLLGVPIALGLVMAGRILLTLWGNGFETGALALGVLSIIYAVSILAGSSGNLLISQESSSQHFVGNIIFIGTALILGLGLIPTFGLIGGGLALGFAHLTQRSYWRWRVQAYFRTEEST